MYHAHFGLQKGLFSDGIATDTAVFRTPRHDQVSAHFKLALGSPSACIVLRGPAGVGKTTLTAATLRASSTRLALAWLNGIPTNPTELLELLLVELGVNTVRTSRIERLQLWRQFLAETRATESRLFIVVERTEDLAAEVLHALDQLTAPDAVGNPGSNLVLLGHSTIDEHLAAPLLESLRQRIRVRTDLAPFSEGELQEYLRHQVACAGGHFDQLFAPGAVAALYRYSLGVARLANTLCEAALDLAAVQRLKQLTPDLVSKTAVSLLGLVAAAPPTRVAPPAAVTFSASLPAPVVVAAVVAPPAPVVIAQLATAPATVPPPVVPTAAPVAAAAPTPEPAREPAPAPTPPATQTPAAAPTMAAAPPMPAAAPSVAPPLAPAAPASFAPRAPAPAAAPARAPVDQAAPAPPPAPAESKPAPVELEFDGGATDISDVAIADFPVLTDAVEEPVTPTKRAVVTAPAAAQPPPVVSRAPLAKPAAPARAPAPPPAPAAAKPAAPTVSRVETAYAPAKAAAASKPPAPSPPAPVAATTPAPTPRRTVDPEDDDLLRQTQTMRAIAVAKSIDDISSSMAETLFGDAELDLVTAALAAGAEWPDDEVASSQAAPEKNAVKSEPAKPAPIDDPFDLFGLGDDAPLELIDDSTLPPIDQSRKSASR